MALLGEADAALRGGGADALAEYQTKSSEADALIRRAERLLRGAGSSAATSTTTTATTTPGSSGATTTTGP